MGQLGDREDVDQVEEQLDVGDLPTVAFVPEQASRQGHEVSYTLVDCPVRPRGTIAKWWLTDVQCRVICKCLQLFGGYGYMREYPIARM